VEPSEQSSPSGRQEEGCRVNRRILAPAAPAAQKLHKALRNVVRKQCTASLTVRLREILRTSENQKKVEKIAEHIHKYTPIGWRTTKRKVE
jgi:hypothetical protein